MATNWNAYEAAKELYGNNVENIQDIGSRFPLFSRAVMAINDENLLDILGAIPKVTARVMETGLKAVADGSGEAEPEEEPKKEEKKAAKKDEDEEEEEEDYESMKAADLYKLCCKRGLSSKCKERNKPYLIKVLKGEVGNEEPEPEDEEDDWADEAEEKDPYEGKTAKELFKMCKDRGVKAKPKMKAADYVKLLKAADEADESEDDAEDDDEWEI